MLKFGNIVCLASLVIVGFLAGCDKKVELTFTNTTSRSLDVNLSIPEEGTTFLGTVGSGGKLKHKLKIEDDDLPANCMWQAGPYGGNFTVNKETPKKLWIDIKPTGVAGPRDEKTTVDEKYQTEVKEVIIEQDTVVE